MGEPIDIKSLTEAQLAEEFIRRRLLTSGQVKAALDYQASVGGKLVQVVTKLGLVQEDTLRTFLRRLAAGEDFVAGEEEVLALSEEDVDLEKLRVHRKLLDKVPVELVGRYGVLFFFPPAGTRAILMSCDPPLGAPGRKRLQELLGVEIRPVELGPEARAPFLEELGRELPRTRSGGDEASPTGSEDGPPASSEVGPAHSESRDGAPDEPSGEDPPGDPASGSPAARSEPASPSGGMDGPVAPDAQPDAADDDSSLSGLVAEVSGQADSGSRSAGAGESGQQAASAAPSGSEDARQGTSGRREGDPTLALRGLLRLLVKKGVISHEELEVEVELLRRADGLRRRAARREPTVREPA